MYIYFVIFFISFIFAFVAEKKYKNGKKIAFYIFSIIGIIIPSVMAGIRASRSRN